MLAVLRAPSGYRDLSVKAAAAGNCRVYLDVDKSPMQMRAELVCRKFAARLRVAAPDGRFFHKKAESLIAMGWVPIVRILDVTAISYRTEWNIPKLTDMDLDRIAIETAVTSELTDPGAAVQWG